MKNKNKIALLEAGGSHEEIMPSQFEFLRTENMEISLFIRKKHLERIKAPLNVRIHEIEEDQSLFSRLKNLLKLRSTLIKENINYLIINTAQGAFIRDLCFFLPHQLNITGISHNPQKLHRSFNQKMINRKIRKYLVLSDPIRKNTQSLNPGLRIESFYPVFYEPLKPGGKKSNEKFNVVIPGAVDLNRRDYKSLLNELYSKQIPDNIQFIFLGRCKSDEARAMRDKFLSICSTRNCIFFNEFIPVDSFLNYILNADIILPLLTPNLGNFRLYRDFKVTGGVNLAYGFRKPMLMHRDLKINSDYSETAFFYEEYRMLETIENLLSNPELLEEKRKSLENTARFSFEYQKRKYLDFVKQGI